MIKQRARVKTEKILTVAEELFAEYGYRKTTVSALAAKAGMAQGALYYYFPSKEVLLEKVLTRYADALIEEIKAVSCSKVTAVEKLHLILAALLKKAEYKDGLLLHLLYDVNNLYVKEKIFAELGNSFRPVLTAVISEGLATGEFSTAYPEVGVDYILLIIDYLTAALSKNGSVEKLEQQFLLAEQLLKSILGVKAGNLIL